MGDPSVNRLLAVWRRPPHYLLVWISEVQSAFRAGRLNEALERAILAWRSSPHPILSEVVERLDALSRDGPTSPAPVRSQAKPLSRTSLSETEAFDQRWMEVLEHARATPDDLLAVGWLATHLECAHISDKENVFCDSRPTINERMEALRSLPPDPRVSVALARIVARGGHWIINPTAFHAFYGYATNLVIQLGDPRSARMLLSLSETPRSSFAVVRMELKSLVESRREELEQIVEATDAPADLDRWAALLRELSPRVDQDTFDSLFARIVEQIEDDRPRQVLADFLLEAGDPRGEYLFLALHGKDPHRLGELERLHREAWLGPDLSQTLNHVRFERGFPVEGQLAVPSQASKATFERAALDPRLGTFTRILGQGEYYDRFVTSPAAPNLRSVRIVTDTQLERLSDSRLNRRFVEVAIDEPSEPRLRVLATAPAFSSLRILQFVAAEPIGTIIGRLDSVGLLKVLHVLRIGGLFDLEEWEELPAAWDQLPSNIQSLKWEGVLKIKRHPEGDYLELLEDRALMRQLFVQGQHGRAREREYHRTVKTFVANAQLVGLEVRRVTRAAFYGA